MFELTGALVYVVPFMIAVQISKWVGGIFGEGIYDCHIHIKKYPYLPEPEEMAITGLAQSIMDDDIECICVNDHNTIGSMLEMLYEFPKYSGFPLIKEDHQEDWILLGYVHAAELATTLQAKLAQDLVTAQMPVYFEDSAQAQYQVAISLRELVDDTIIRIVPDTPLFLVHQIFHKLGLRFVAVVMQGKLKGLITKKAFVKMLHDSDPHGHNGKVQTAKDNGGGTGGGKDATGMGGGGGPATTNLPSSSSSSTEDGFRADSKLIATGPPVSASQTLTNFFRGKMPSVRSKEDLNFSGQENTGGGLGGGLLGDDPQRMTSPLQTSVSGSGSPTSPLQDYIANASVRMVRTDRNLQQRVDRADLKRVTEVPEAEGEGQHMALLMENLNRSVGPGSGSGRGKERENTSNY